MSHVAGFTVAHDVSARDWQMEKNGRQWLLGKTFDTFCPLGPALVTKDSVSGMEVAKPFCLLVSHGCGEDKTASGQLSWPAATRGTPSFLLGSLWVWQHS